MKPLVAAVCLTALAGCLDSAGEPAAEQAPAGGFPQLADIQANGTGYPDAWRPPVVPADFGLTDLVPLAAVGGPAHGITVWGHYVFSGHYSPAQLEVIDIANPAAPMVVATAEVPMRDAGIIAYPDGRLVLISTGGGTEVYATNVTDPSHPELMSVIDLQNDAHNIAVVPGTAIVYDTGRSIADFTDPENPVKIGTFEGLRCHDISFYMGADKQRAYCAAYDAHEIWDIADPRAPRLLSTVYFPFGQPVDDRVPATLDHTALVNHDATVLIVGDEAAGGAGPLCFGEHHTPLGTRSAAHGSLWFWDLSDEMNPVLRSWLSAPPTSMDGICTAHFGQVIGDTNHMVMSWYTAGTTLIDFTDLDHPSIVDQHDPYNPLVVAGAALADPLAVLTGTWDVWAYQGYAITGDQHFGVEILALR